MGTATPRRPDPAPPAAPPGAAALCLVLVLALCLGSPAAAQDVIRDDEDLDFDRPEAWAMKYFTSTSLFTGFGVPERRVAGSLEVGVGFGWIPELDEDERQVGFRGSKVEDVNKAPVLARLRAELGLGAGWSLTVGYVPPVDVFDVEPHLLSASLNRPLYEGRHWRLGGRLYGQVGTIESDITCPDEVAGVDDPLVNPSDCEEPSSDEMTMRYAGVELSAGRDDGGRWVPYAAVAANRLDMEFQVDALTFGVRDRSLLTADGWTWSATAGLRYRLGSRAELAAEAFYTPLEVNREGDGSSGNDPLFNVRALVTYDLW